MNMMESSCVPPGFRFHPTEEELVGYYLNRKVNDLKIDLDVITEIDLYRMEPWDIQDKCNLGYEEQSEWYFFSHKDRKYPTGTRTNRATAAGFWKATGRDKAVLSKEKLIGMRKTLVFYNGRAPNGRKTDWIMHEYRLQVSQHCPPQEEGWVVCRAFKKPCPSHQQKQGYEAWSSSPSYNYSYYNNYNRSSSENMANFQPPPPQQQPPTSIFRPNFEQIPYASDHQDQLIMLSNQQQTSFIDNINNDYHLPQLDDSSSTFVTKEALINNNNDREEEEDAEWKLLEAVSRADHVIEPSSLFVSQFNHQPLLLPAHHRDHHDHELLRGCFSTTTDV